jgi:hypothetical protein
VDSRLAESAFPHLAARAEGAPAAHAGYEDRK